MSLGVIACDEDETVYTPLNFPDEAFVAFEGGTVTVPEGSTDDIVVKVFLATVNQGANVTVDFTISSSNAVLGTHYEIVDNKSQFSIAAGEYSDDIIIKLIDNTDTDGNKELTITLTGNSAGANIGYLGPDAFGSSLDLMILDDDCPLELAGEYTELSETHNSGNATDVAVGLSTISGIVAGANPNEYLITGVYSNLYTRWGESFQSGFGSEGITLMIDNGDGTVTIPCQYLGQTLPGPWDYTVDGSGVYSSCDKTLSLTIALSDQVDSCPRGWYVDNLLLELK